MYHQKCSLHKSLSAFSIKMKSRNFILKNKSNMSSTFGEDNRKVFRKVVIRKDLIQTPCFFLYDAHNKRMVNEAKK